MSPVLKRFLFFAVPVLIGAAGIHAWRTRPSPADATNPPPEAVRHSQRTSRVAAPASLNSITDAGQAWQVRVALLRNALRSECGEPEIRYMYELLAKGPPKGELPEHWYIIANEFMGQLLSHDTDCERLSSNLLRLLQDARQPLVLRDYAVQYLVTMLSPHSRQSPTGQVTQPPPAIATQILDALITATKDPLLEQSSIPGTTLMMLVNLVRSPGDVDCTQAITALKPWLTLALQDGSSLSTPVRVSAVQAAGVLAPNEFRPTLRRLAYQENGQSSLRLPAIAAIAHCGESADLEKLEQITRTHPELFYAAREAGTTLATRLARAEPQSGSE
ncbi:MAG: hypothetical protein WCP35_05635 [Verrucomicrobiota bacterium]